MESVLLVFLQERDISFYHLFYLSYALIFFLIYYFNFFQLINGTIYMLSKNSFQQQSQIRLAQSLFAILVPSSYICLLPSFFPLARSRHPQEASAICHTTTNLLSACVFTPYDVFITRVQQLILGRPSQCN